MRTSLYLSYSVFGEKKVSRTNLKYFSEAVVSERLSFGSSRVNCFVLARIDFEARYAAHQSAISDRRHGFRVVTFARMTDRSSRAASRACSAS